MLNPSVEPTARRESTRERRDSEGKARRDSASANPRENKQRPSVGGRDSVDAGISGSVLAAKGADSTTSAAEARNQRRSIGLQVRGVILCSIVCVCVERVDGGVCLVLLYCYEYSSKSTYHVEDIVSMPGL